MSGLIPLARGERLGEGFFGLRAGFGMRYHTKCANPSPNCSARDYRPALGRLRLARARLLPSLRGTGICP
jgi:hypothetical protein